MKTMILLSLLLMIFGAALYAEATEEIKLDDPREEKLEAFHVIGLQIKDSMESEEMMKLWMDYFEVRDLIPDRYPEADYGVTYFTEDFDPQTWKGFYYLVGSQVKSLENIPEPLVGHTVPGGLYLVFEHLGSVASIGKSYDYIFSMYFMDSKYQPLMQEVFERYGERFKHGNDKSVLEIWVPVKRKG
ncbi:MAG: GyrI-like domain-containing protein [Candidatus Cloacimonadaceae bacterium]|nr:GyrI-like domain-containing protein [Candidatus Cloacimonadaceae bacterium]